MAQIHQTPNFSKKYASDLIHQLYNLSGNVSSLPSERDQNFLIETEFGELYTFKISNSVEKLEYLHAQQQVMHHLSKSNLACPQIIPSVNNKLIEKAKSITKSDHFVRLVTYLPGQPYGEIKRQSSILFTELGKFIGRMDKAFTEIDHPAIHRDFQWDIANGPRIVNQYSCYIDNSELRDLIFKLSLQYEKNIVPLLPNLKQSIIHNDLNDHNVIVKKSDDLYEDNQVVKGVIDFGDMVYSYMVADLAVAIAYAILNKNQPLKTAALIIKNYNAENPLESDDLRVIFGMVCMRLCMSVALAAYQSNINPHNEYLVISQEHIRKTLPILSGISPIFAEATFRHACGLDPSPKTTRIKKWLEEKENNIHPILGYEVNSDTCIHVDLSIRSPLISLDKRPETFPIEYPDFINNVITNRKRVGISGYNETRLSQICQSPQTDKAVSLDDHTIHLGVDLFCEPGTPVYAPIDGRLHAVKRKWTGVKNNSTLVLKHETDSGEVFFTKYVNLDIDIPYESNSDELIKAGTYIGAIGSRENDPDWIPYLHFQFISDLLDLNEHFPVSCQPDDKEIWLIFSPDPYMLLKANKGILPPRIPSKLESLTARRTLIGLNLSLGYRKPLKIERGYMQYVYDEEGRKYLDAYNNVPHVGHCHPKVVEAGSGQMRVLNTNTRYLHDFIHQFAEELLATLPKPLEVCFFVNSGSEANELSLRLSRAYTHEKNLIVLNHAYHGNTTSLIDISPYKHNGPGGGGPPEWVHVTPIPDVFRGKFKSDDPDAGVKYAQFTQDIINSIHQRGSGLSGFIAESCPSVGGQILLPKDYLTHVYKMVREVGGVCIADEVQTGYGRIGTHFYAFERHEVIPDIVVLGKPVGNGHPIGIVITTREIAAAFDNGMEFFSTFGGNPVSCAIGLAVLNIVKEEELQKHALDVGQELYSRLSILKSRYPIVGDVRGSGLFFGVELVLDRNTLEPATREAEFIVNRMCEMGILLGTDGPFHNVIKIRPPMPFSREDVNQLVSSLELILDQDFNH